MEPRLLAVSPIGVAVVAVILWTRLDAFPGPLTGALVTGLIAGPSPTDVLTMVNGGPVGLAGGRADRHRAARRCRRRDEGRLAGRARAAAAGTYRGIRTGPPRWNAG